MLGSLVLQLELCHSLRVYLAANGNASATARALYLHRNAILSRLARAGCLLHQPLTGHTLNTALALEILYWFGLSDVPCGPAAYRSRLRREGPVQRSSPRRGPSEALATASTGGGSLSWWCGMAGCCR
ncbi:helix-turn-helix domain-containing protein [Actinomadura opuntiae]|uniref:helix-turn-helix domain-containing protein n=1 Tax=Actinomadura sp. OS1-43 TaxID=604315 RepID=UPI00333FAEBA